MKRLVAGLTGLVLALGAIGPATGAILLHPDSVDGTTHPNPPLTRTLDVIHDGITYDRGYDYFWESTRTDGTPDHTWMEFSWNEDVLITSSTIYAWNATPYGPGGIDGILHYLVKSWNGSAWDVRADVTNSDIDKTVFEDSFANPIQTRRLRIDFLDIIDNEAYLASGGTSGHGDVAEINEWEVRGEQASAVPEPSTLVLWSTLSAMGFVAARRRRKRATSD
jgi:hypothetical protein